MLQIRMVERESDQVWDSIVKKSKAGLIYHTSKWREATISAAPGKFKPIYLIAEIEEEPCGVFPLFLDHHFLANDIRSLPFCSSGGPCILEGVKRNSVVGAFLEFLDELVVKQRVRSVKVFPSFLDNSLTSNNVFSSHGFSTREVSQIVLSLDKSMDQLWSGLDKKLRNSIRKARKSGLETEVLQGEKQIHAYYDLYLRTMTRRGAAAKPFSLFESLYRLFGPQGFRIVFCKYRGEYIGGAVFLIYRGIMHYWSASSLKEYWGLNCNDLLLCSSAEWGIETGKTLIDLGVGLKAGTYEFKKKWASQEIPLRRNVKNYPARDLWEKTVWGFGETARRMKRLTKFAMARRVL